MYRKAFDYQSQSSVDNDPISESEGHQIHLLLRRMITEGYLVIRSLHYTNGEHKEEYLWVDETCHAVATFSLEFGRKMWDVAEYWLLTTTKRYSRQSNGVLVDDYMLRLLNEAIENGSKRPNHPFHETKQTD